MFLRKEATVDGFLMRERGRPTKKQERRECMREQEREGSLSFLFFL